MSRESFLERVRQAARAGQAYRVERQTLADSTGYVGVAGDLCECFAAECTAAGGTVHRADNVARARQILLDRLGHYQPRSALCWRHPLLEQLGLEALLAGSTIQRHDFDTLSGLVEQQQREAAFAADVGITSTDCAVAETGSLLVCARPGQERWASLLPPVHIAVVERAQIVADLMDAFDFVIDHHGLENLPSNFVLITGPSKTGDIELQLTTGVHGPGRWEIILIG